MAGNNWFNAIKLSWMILARMLNVWLLLLASFSFLCTKGVDPANPSTSTKTNLLHTPPFVGLLHGASRFCRCCGLTKDHTVQRIKLAGCVQETRGQYLILLFVSAWQSLSLISCTSKVLKDDCLKEPQLPPFLTSVFQFLGRRTRAGRGPGLL